MNELQVNESREPRSLRKLLASSVVHVQHLTLVAGRGMTGWSALQSALMVQTPLPKWRLRELAELIWPAFWPEEE